MGKPASKSVEKGQLHLNVSRDILKMIEEIEEYYERTVGIRPRPGNVIELAVRALAEKSGLRAEAKHPGSAAG